MGLNFRKSFKIAPGVRLNLGKKGISSVSVGGKVGRLSVSKKGITSSVSAPGTGLSYTSHQSFKTNNSRSNSETTNTLFDGAPPPLPLVPDNGKRKVSNILLIGILFMPYIFAWFTLRKGHTGFSRFISFSWLILVLIMFS